MMQITHGGDVYSTENTGAVDFSANINPLGLPQSVKNAIAAACGDCEKYPDPLCRCLRAALSDYEGVPEQSIFCSNGASEILYRIAWAFKPRGVLVTAPAFSEYRQASETVGAEIHLYHLREENGFEIAPDILPMIDGTIEIVFICNPNNPTGIPTPRETIRQIADRCRQTDTLLVVDECFMDFLANGAECYSAKPLLKEYDNLILLKAFTKIFAMPGIRLGYCLTGNLDTIERLSVCGQPWSVSTFAQAAGVAASKEKAFVERSRAYVGTERTYLARGLAALGFKVYPSSANYLFFKADSADLKARLLQKGFLIRSCANFDGLDGRYYRAAVRAHDENAALLGALEALN